MNKSRMAGACALVTVALASSAQATLITFTGGTATMLDTSTAITNTASLYAPVDHYDESGFRMDFIPSAPGAYAGPYYGAGNDVIHAHWEAGGLGATAAIEITQIGGGTFDFHAFTLTSNTAVGGGAATGTEQAWIQGYVGVIPVTPPYLLPSENWGFPSYNVTLGSDFDAVDRVAFFVTSDVDCFGMDDFYINEVPAPGALALFGIGGLAAARRRRA